MSLKKHKNQGLSEGVRAKVQNLYGRRLIGKIVGSWWGRGQLTSWMQWFEESKY